MQKAIFFVGLAGTLWALASTEVPGDQDRAAPSAAGAFASGVATVESHAAEREESDSEQTFIERDGSGQFHVGVRIDGQDSEFLIDTGADVTALTIDEAERLGLPIDPATFRPLTRTASGVGIGTVVKLASLEVAGAEMRNVDAVVIEGLPVNLLGQNVLSQLGSVSLEGNRMVIRR